MTLPGSAEEFWRRLSHKVRGDQRWKAKKLLNNHSGNVRVRCFREASELESMIQDIEQVAKKTYQRGLGVGFVDSAEIREYLSVKAQKGWMRTYVLYIAGRPCAFNSATLYKGVCHGDFMGYDPEYSKYSPGTYLFIRMIEDFCERREGTEIATIDFGLGDAAYKETFCDAQWQDASAYIFAPTFRGLKLNALRTPITFVDRVGRHLLQRAGLLTKIKTLWRNHAAQRERRPASPGDDPPR